MGKSFQLSRVGSCGLVSSNTVTQRYQELTVVLNRLFEVRLSRHWKVSTMPNRKGRRTKPQRLERVYGLFECQRCKHRWGDDEVRRYERTHEVLSPTKCKICGEMNFPHTTERLVQERQIWSEGFWYNPSCRPDHHSYRSWRDNEHHFDDIYEDRQQPKHNKKLDTRNDGDECHQRWRGGFWYNPSCRPDHDSYSSGSDNEHHYDDIYEDRQQPKHNKKLDTRNDGDECHQRWRGGFWYNPSCRPDHHSYSFGSDNEHHYDDIYEDRQQPKHNKKLERRNDGDECHQPRKRGAKRNKAYNYD
ncbi:uncharacterized protein LOC125378509 [Haliotis rufescens]|uniref:uncharacterized protein LOC125378509 n=1 Tax=Haliotis rufescens TaxID=6454 RepID=UPI00201F2352|nr:uncharacterized protein LOC125378509 [Haliotis rufescens]XP_048249859.1 uncharacterized protein LOC125378509 [Haliotis rufescens]XP_048249860.1 uncharacterized protein LOC125378509 [Haliotis rufescens]